MWTDPGQTIAKDPYLYRADTIERLPKETTNENKGEKDDEQNAHEYPVKG